MVLHLGGRTTLPDEAVTQTFGILAKRGAGKSNAGAVMAEEMFAADLPFVVVDPVGAWWGLRSSSDGKQQGLALPIFGGYRGDVPLEPGSGKLMADLIVGENLSAVLDVSSFESEENKRRFLADFAERLYLQKGKPGQDDPLHLFLEEADDFIPQGGNRGGSLARCLGAFERIVKRGRARGLGATMITQRSASLNKDVLTQIETLIVLRTVSPQDRDAIKRWLEFHGQAEEILSSLATLAPGEAWMWSMWLDRTKRLQIRRRTTFDSGATPSVKAKRVMATLADVDLSAIETQMKETIERAKADDPRELQRRIRELEREAAAPEVVERVTEVEVPVEVPVLGESDRSDMAKLRGMLEGIAEGIQALTARLDAVTTGVGERAERALPAATRGDARGPKAADRGRTPPRSTGDQGALVRPKSDPEGEPVRTDVTRPMQKILDAIAWWNVVGYTQPTKLQVGFVAGYRVGKRIGGNYGNLLGQLRGEGWIGYPTAGTVELTAAGQRIADPPVIPPNTRDLHDAVFARLNGPERRILEVLIDAYPEPMSKQECGARAGYTVGDRVGGNFGNLLGRLRSLGLIEYPVPGDVVALPVLFLEEVR